ncbi:acyl carrier protein [Chengkuizengella axinellae]|uniref:Acyl carrier protein n=1 Tax=Chengkuizengella axinellae TaxID=3064388 RepID=A0ABT9IYZ6_9BACL|nr:acyl carrier protein [Chengkuizengella sp. 2205SS18-9]MDP5274594.1 acyl carrier protein [Chengkuizengella sp. 2205SS18-9]
MINVKQEIINSIKEITVGHDIQEFIEEVLLSDLGIDSIKYVELLVSIEEKCDVEFDESDLGADALKSLGDLINLVNKTLEQKVS